jgi:hypothetical protein
MNARAVCRLNLPTLFVMQSLYPTLFQIAQYVLALPASSGDIEREFSFMNLVYTASRNRLGQGPCHVSVSPVAFVWLMTLCTVTLLKLVRTYQGLRKESAEYLERRKSAARGELPAGGVKRSLVMVPPPGVAQVLPADAAEDEQLDAPYVQCDVAGDEDSGCSSAEDELDAAPVLPATRTGASGRRNAVIAVAASGGPKRKRSDKSDQSHSSDSGPEDASDGDVSGDTLSPMPPHAREQRSYPPCSVCTSPLESGHSLARCAFPRDVAAPSGARCDSAFHEHLAGCKKVKLDLAAVFPKVYRSKRPVRVCGNCYDIGNQMLKDLAGGGEGVLDSTAAEPVATISDDQAVLRADAAAEAASTSAHDDSAFIGIGFVGLNLPTRSAPGTTVADGRSDP